MKRMLILTVLVRLMIQGQLSAQISYYTYDSLEQRVLMDQKNLTVIKFWATWCKPCIEELPDFEKIHANYGGKKVKVILANLDFHSRVAAVLPAFLESNKVKAEVIHITDEDDNEWISKAYETWSGAIPAALVIYKGEKIWFREGKTGYSELESLIKKYIKP